MSTDETAAIIKCTEHIVKVQENLSLLEDDTLVKPVQLLNYLRKLYNYFTEANLITISAEYAPTFVCYTQQTDNL